MADDNITRRELDANREADAAKTDVKFERLIGEMRVMHSEIRGDISRTEAKLSGEIGALNARVGGVEKYTAGTKTTIIAAVVGSFLGILAIMLAAINYGSDMFGVGLNAGDVADRAAKTAIERIQKEQPMSFPVPAPEKKKQ